MGRINCSQIRLLDVCMALLYISYMLFLLFCIIFVSEYTQKYREVNFK